MPADPTRTFRQAVALGVIQGPSELLPISSSAHTRLIPWLAGWGSAGAGEDRGRSFELALHGAAALALSLEMAGPLREELGPPGRRRALTAALALAPPALCGLALRRTIERRLSGPRASAAGLIAGALAMALADCRGADPGRSAPQAGPLDGLALGLAQALALAPGVSRNGATLTAARARGFARPAAQRLSWAAGLPVMIAASATEALRATAELRGAGAPERRALIAGAGAAFVSTCLSARALASGLERRALWPYAVYRCLLGGLILVRARRAQ
jgi:undecaprenyl-diphosphatase